MGELKACSRLVRAAVMDNDRPASPCDPEATLFWIRFTSERLIGGKMFTVPRGRAATPGFTLLSLPAPSVKTRCYADLR